MADDPTLPDPLKLGTEQRYLLQTIFDVWRDKGVWPVWLYVHYEMKRRGFDAASVLRTLPARFVRGVRVDAPTAQEETSLSIAGINQCERAQAQKKAIITLLRIAIQADLVYQPEPDNSSGPEVDEQDLVTQGLRLDMLRPLSQVLDHWVGQLYQRAKSPPDSAHATRWVLRVSPEVNRFGSVTDLDQYVAAVADWLDKPFSRRNATKQIFVLMPFDERQQPVYDAIRSAVANVEGFICKRSDEITSPGRISFQIIQAIQDADLVLVDLYGHNPNVMYELGFAHAAGKPTILLAPRRYKSPFDIHDWRYIEYSHADLAKLSEKLQAWLSEPTSLATLPATLR